MSYVAKFEASEKYKGTNYYPPRHPTMPPPLTFDRDRFHQNLEWSREQKKQRHDFSAQFLGESSAQAKTVKSQTLAGHAKSPRANSSSGEWEDEAVLKELNSLHYQIFICLEAWLLTAFGCSPRAVFLVFFTRVAFIHHIQ